LDFFHYSDLTLIYSKYVSEEIQNDHELHLEKPKFKIKTKEFLKVLEKSSERMNTRLSSNKNQKGFGMISQKITIGKKFKFFTNEEIDAIIQGITIFGCGKWTQIL
jgi:hypothetical protein